MAKQALILTDGKTLVDWSEDHDYSQDGSNIYRPADHTIITESFTSLPANWKDHCWVWNDDRNEFDNVDEVNSSIPFNPIPHADHCACGEIDIETVDVNPTGVGSALHLDTDGNWIEAKGDNVLTMPCMAVALELGTGQKKVLKKGYIRDDSWSWTVSGWIFASYSTAGAFTQSEASATGEIQQKLGYAYRSNIIWFDPDKSMLKYK